MVAPLPVVWSLSLRLPWPPVALSPNRLSGRNWATVWGAKKRYKAACHTAVIALQPRVPRPPLGERIAMAALFHPPDRHARDLDNALAAIKYALDGVALALGVDDRLFRPWTVDFGEPVKGGAVELRLEARGDAGGLLE